MERHLTVEHYLSVLRTRSAGSRHIDRVVLHHTYAPTHKQWRGDASASAVLDYWRQRQDREGWRNPPGGHFLVAPAGLVYVPFPLAQLLNANSDTDANAHGVAVEVVGNFDKGHDALDGAQRHAVFGLLGGLLVRFGLTEEDLFFHRDYAAKTCPGTGLKREDVRKAAVGAMAWARRVMGG